ncbi:hypothetical protein [Alteromonas sp. ASW11-130]|uniref:hypothetical protein n=1 Tax=Alteromonas sp. ASW11-130 TaxID=3015775 RepID=UPI00224277E4|nr:hypothetical protein [Alteromonas sp. ASW11-130]MCW8092496.1 hypothetical protein [Alteromonas sp. ASW11-130]
MSSNESKKRLAAELADKVYSEGNDFAQLLAFTGLLNTENKDASLSSVDSLNKDLIGVWKKQPETGSFVRDMAQSADWNYWAQQPVLNMEKAGKRVVLVGESVARGMLYDPSYTPAQVLSHMLNSQQGADEVEVIDLARTNANINILEEVVASCRQLSPDAIVIFAGNNWVGNRAYLNSVDNSYDISDSIKQDGIKGLRTRLTEALNSEVESFIDKVNSHDATANTEIYWVVPEFNLGDWRDPHINVHWLEGKGDNEKWLSLKHEAESLHGSGEFKASIECAKKMLELDKGDCSATAYILADCHQELGEYDLQRQYLEMARDAAIVDLTRSYTPRITNDIRNIVKVKSAQYDNKLIDLREVFSERFEKVIPGRELFLDYCHLTSTGIRTAMAEVACEISLSMLGKERTAKQFIENAPVVNAKDEADAHLLAAIHNAHWGQSFDVVSYYCKEAVDKSKDVLQIMKLFVEIQNKRLPIWMNNSLSEALDDISPQVKRYLFSMGTNCLDQLLFDAFSTCCSQHDIQLDSYLSKIQNSQHTVGNLDKINLLDPYFHSTSFSETQLIEGGANNRNDYYKAYMASSQFCFFTDAEREQQLKVTLKLVNQLKNEQRVFIKINGQVVEKVLASNEWKSCHITLPKKLLVAGINYVQLEWPEQILNANEHLERICSDINGQLVPEIYPIYGNVFSLEVC